MLCSCLKEQGNVQKQHWVAPVLAFDQQPLAPFVRDKGMYNAFKLFQSFLIHAPSEHTDRNALMVSKKSGCAAEA